MSSEQIGKAKQLSTKLYRDTRELNPGNEKDARRVKELQAEAAKAAAELLDAAQLRRVRQLKWQMVGADAFFNQKVANTLQLTVHQGTLIKKAYNEGRMDVVTEGDKLRSDPKQKEKLYRRFNETALSRVMKILTDEQKTKYRNLVGEIMRDRLPFLFVAGYHGPVVTGQKEK